MSRLFRFCRRWSADLVFRRALEDVEADWYVERRAARGASGRLMADCATFVALARIAGASVAQIHLESPMKGFAQDLRYAVRRLACTPVFSVFSVLTLAIAIGATTAVYSLIHVVLGPPPGIADTERVVDVYHAGPLGSVPIVAFSWPDFEDLQARQTAFSGIAGWSFFRQQLSAAGVTATGWGEVVTGRYFETLGVRAELGRVLGPSDDRVGAPPVAVISHGTWQRIFAGRSDVLGQTVRMNGAMFQVVGVAARPFAGVFNGGLVPTMMWVPMSAARTMPASSVNASFDAGNRDRRWVLVKARLAPGRTLQSANAEVAALGHALDQSAPIGLDLPSQLRMPYARSRPWNVQPLGARPMGVPPTILASLAAAMLIAVVLVLLVACSNLANLTLARHGGRRGTFAIARALGATRWRVVREVMVESVLLSIAGGVVGFGVAAGLMQVMSSEIRVGGVGTLQSFPHMDGIVISAGVLATLVAMLTAGVIPAWQSTRADLRTVLTHAGGGSLPRWRGRRYLIAAQVAASTLLVSLAALSAVQVVRERRIDTGMDLSHLAFATINFAAQQYTPDHMTATIRTALGRLSHAAGIESVAASSGLPIGVDSRLGSAGAIDAPNSRLSVGILAATTDIFTTLGVPIISGRAFEDADQAPGSRVAVLNEVAARQLFASTNVVGRSFWMLNARYADEPAPVRATFTVVGVAAATDARVIGKRDTGLVYVPFDAQPQGNVVLSVKTSGAPARAAAAIRTTLGALEPDLVVTDVATGDTLASGNQFLKIMAGFSSGLGMVALALALAGLYGVLAHVVTARRREMGLRIALGAMPASIVRMVIVEGMSPVLMGLVAGAGFTVLAAMVAGSVARTPFPLHLGVFTAVPLFFAAAGVAACFIPARRASTVDPNVTLRDL